jgi:hypothetical protein
MDTQHFWEGAVGISISTRINQATNDPFYTFELVRCFKRDGSGEVEYTHSFSREQIPVIQGLVERAERYMDRNPLVNCRRR